MRILAFISMSLLIAGVIFVSGCASTSSVSAVDPDFLEVKYERFCIFFDSEDLVSRSELENETVKAFGEAGLYAIQGSVLFPPTREWGDSQIHETLMKEGIDACIRITLTDQYVDEKIIPGETVTETVGEMKKRRKGKEEYVETTTTRVEPDRTVRTYYSNFRTKIVDVKSSKVAWTATSKSSGDDLNLIYKSYSKDILKTLAKDVLIRAIM